VSEQPGPRHHPFLAYLIWPTCCRLIGQSIVHVVRPTMHAPNSSCLLPNGIHLTTIASMNKRFSSSVASSHLLPSATMSSSLTRILEAHGFRQIGLPPIALHIHRSSKTLVLSPSPIQRLRLHCRALRLTMQAGRVVANRKPTKLAASKCLRVLWLSAN